MAGESDSSHTWADDNANLATQAAGQNQQAGKGLWDLIASLFGGGGASKSNANTDTNTNTYAPTPGNVGSAGPWGL